jgi:AraC family transcriptional regulator
VQDFPNLANPDCVARINRAIDYVTAHLADPLPLADVARAAGFSSYHFHRIFRGFMDETLASFVKRTRLERAVYLLSHRRGATLTEIALACGFSSSADFSRSFRAHYGVAPRAFDVAAYRRSRRLKWQSATSQSATSLCTGMPAVPDTFVVTLRHLPSRRIAYIRVHRPYERTGVVDAARRLLEWAEARGLADGQWLGYQWEDPDIVPLEKCRYDVGVEVPAGVGADDGVSICELPAMHIAEIPLSGTLDLEMRAIDWLYRTWLPASGYAPAHLPAFEAWDGRPFAHGMEHFRLRIQLPVVDARVPL